MSRTPMERTLVILGGSRVIHQATGGTQRRTPKRKKSKIAPSGTSRAHSTPALPPAFPPSPPVAAADGGGAARLYGGRWNSKGVAVAYGRGTLSLAALETLVHADADLLSGAGFVACEVKWPDTLPVASLTIADCEALTPSW